MKENNMISRRGFVGGLGFGAMMTAASGCLGTRSGEKKVAFDPSLDYDVIQREIDEVKGRDFQEYVKTGEVRFAALARLEDAFERVLKEVKETKVVDRPAVWYMYNMGVVVKTKEALFSIDLMHRRATEMVPLLDFALITHNHCDHYSRDFYEAMDGAGKTVINNFECNYGVEDWFKDGGYTHGVKVFKIKDVEIKTGITDHNPYLIDFTSTFEIKVGDFRIFHTGDCASLDKINPEMSPDLWFVHPGCWLKVPEGYCKFKPKLTVIGHLNELGHDRWRFPWQYGLDWKAKVEEVGGKAIVPTWGVRVSG